MKKGVICLTLFFSIFFASVVFAADNTLHFTDSGNRLKYDTTQFNQNTFISHVDMVPGRTYEDILVIENGTRKTYPLYLKIRDSERSELVDEILENVIMEIYLDNKLVYSGNAKGIDYVQNKKIVEDSLYLGQFEGHSNHKILVRSTMKSEYTNTKNNALASVDWDFITMYADDIDTINPNTGDNLIIYAIMLFGLSLVVMVITFIMMNKKTKAQA